MTDMELAEEYYYKTFPVTLDIGEEERKKKVTDIFLSGLKAGRPNWHKVADGDLPDGERVILNQKGMATLYNPFLGFDGIGVIAWCEIPIYTGE